MEDGGRRCTEERPFLEVVEKAFMKPGDTKVIEINQGGRVFFLFLGLVYHKSSCATRSELVVNTERGVIETQGFYCDAVVNTYAVL